MNIEELKKISPSPNALVEKLNEDYKTLDLARALLDPLVEAGQAEEYEGICAECSGQTEQVSRGDEGWTVCSCCQQVEGKTLEITALPSVGVAFNWNAEEWIIIPENLGESL